MSGRLESVLTLLTESSRAIDLPARQSGTHPEDKSFGYSHVNG